ncbi:hypothetical protein VCHA54P489_80172 [Vibrio chagasii]|uniref:hypothetical protein n=1 Tax=Vibrio chagasii TaxID=170679 RepID=UPI001EFE0FE3|nr:hypothetical protein [Vibrio chagasii]MCG9674492.1 hypothetical protein [Vibrio chagasii]CAH7382867.1 hypothetical protein VCHA54P489_80172 [Vibrio chagasii]CAH7408472.1 hypothetical protein VCHA49P380_80018 [Vibrio chagasii]CAH7416016.1 hypothetical protein VCHA37P202_70175 [Vibrio chagasii]CAH7427965.1 hypothetical protein VCHA49P381_80173 [Vibrio chagasii]
MKLLLHIGFHKTGTTFLQSTFQNNRELLEKKGLYYPSHGSFSNSKGEAISGHDKLVEGAILGKGVKELLPDMDKPISSVMLSAENLTHPFSPYKLEMFLDSKFCGDEIWEQIIILVSYKHPNKMISSHYLEVMLNGVNKRHLFYSDFIKLKKHQLERMLYNTNKRKGVKFIPFHSTSIIGDLSQCDVIPEINDTSFSIDNAIAYKSPKVESFVDFYNVKNINRINPVLPYLKLVNENFKNDFCINDFEDVNYKLLSISPGFKDKVIFKINYFVIIFNGIKNYCVYKLGMKY